MMLKKLFGIKFITLFGMLVLAVLIFGLSWHSSNTYQQLALDNQHQFALDLVKIKTNDLIEQLREKQKLFAYRLQTEEKFRKAFASGNVKETERLLHQVFSRVYAIGGLIHFKSILVRDLEGIVFAAASENPSQPYFGCPMLVDQISQSVDPQNLKAKYALCSIDNRLMSEVLVSIGSLRPKGYLHVVSYVDSELSTLSTEINLPVLIQTPQKATLFQSESWEPDSADNNFGKPIMYTHFGDDNVPGLTVSTFFDPSRFSQQFKQTRLNIQLMTFLSTLSVVFIVLMLLNYAFRSIDKIRNSVGALLTGQYATVSEKDIPFEFSEFVSVYNEMVYGLEKASKNQEIAESELRHERDFISTTMDSINNSVLVVNSKMIVKLVNPAAENLMGDLEKNLIEHMLEDIAIFYTNRSATRIANLKQLLKTPQQLVNLFYQRDDEMVELEMTASPMVDKESEEVGHVLIFKDVTEDRKLRRKLNYEGRHDKLTGLLNRTEFERKFESMINESDDTRNQHIMAYLNLDRFKVVNEACGSVAGDQLLKQVAEIIKQNIRKSDFLARLGGDEFGILLPYADPQAAANTINDMLTYIHQSGFNWNNMEYTLSASAALIPFGFSADDFSVKFSNLTTACSLAKENDGNQYYLVGDEDEKVQQHHSSLGWAAGINKGFNEHRFILYVQPIVPLTHREDRQHFEVLIRYQSDDDTVILPGEFLAPAERFNLIERIDRWVVTEIIDWLAKHHDVKDQIQFSINLSGRSIGSPGFHQFLEQLLATNLVDTSCLCFEITETAAIKDVERSIEFIKTIKALGARFSLDDFGSGLSSFTYLKQFPVDYLKIDGVFIKDIIYDAESYAFVRAITEVGHCLGMKVIAEFVESKNIFHMLREAKVDYLQGYTVGKPAPLDQIDLSTLQKKNNNK